MPGNKSESRNKKKGKPRIIVLGLRAKSQLTPMRFCKQINKPVLCIKMGVRLSKLIGRWISVSWSGRKKRRF